MDQCLFCQNILKILIDIEAGSDFKHQSWSGPMLSKVWVTVPVFRIQFTELTVAFHFLLASNYSFL